MIQSGLASFTVLSRETPPDAITRILGIEPTEIKHKGTVLRSGRVQECNVWSIHSERVENTPEDRTGTLALRWLLERTRAAAGRVADLPDDCEPRIWWSAYSDSPQGGFVLPVELSHEISALGTDMYVSVYVEEEDSDEPDSRNGGDA